MKCKPVTALPVGEKWTFEIKFDGYRCIVLKRGKEVTLFSRHKKVLNKRFPGIVDAFASLDGDFVLDGELVALDSKGRPSFQILQNNLVSDSSGLFLLLRPAKPRWGNFGEFASSPIEERRDLLHSMFATPEDPLRLSPLFHAQAEQVLEAVRKLGLEGVVGKRIGSVYEPGERSGAWIKHRTNMEQEFVIGGYIPGARGFDALLVGVYQNKQLIFSAKVKNGLLPRIQDELFPALKALQLRSAPSRISLRLRSPSRRRKETLGRRSSRSPARRGPAGTWPPRAPSRAARPARLACAA
jgi:ATP-dependent DNA ligase